MFYSAYDLFQDIMKGKVNEFLYNGEKFTVTMGNNGSLTVHGRGFKATNRKYNNEGLTDLQGMAACLIEHNKDLWFDAEGELCDEKTFDPTKRPRHKILEQNMLNRQAGLRVIAFLLLASIALTSCTKYGCPTTHRDYFRKGYTPGPGRSHSWNF